MGNKELGWWEAYDGGAAFKELPDGTMDVDLAQVAHSCLMLTDEATKLLSAPAIKRTAVREKLRLLEIGIQILHTAVCKSH